jgi:hypothetical protein
MMGLAAYRLKPSTEGGAQSLTHRPIKMGLGIPGGSLGLVLVSWYEGWKAEAGD